MGNTATTANAATAGDASSAAAASTATATKAANAATTAIAVVKSGGRNRTLEWVKLISAFFVIFIHYRFPGVFGEFITSTAKYAVPLFFMVSGYFSLGISDEKVKRRALHILKLFVMSFLLYVAYNIFLYWYSPDKSVEDLGQRLLSIRTLARLVFLDVTPMTSHLWFLVALLYCYLFLWFVKKMPTPSPVNNKWLYLIAVFLYVLNFFIEVVCRAGGIDVPVVTFRTFLILGIPTFFAGMFIREYEERLPLISVRTAVLFTVVCLVLGFIQQMGFSEGEATVGTTVFAGGLLVWCVRHPKFVPDSPFAVRAATIAGKLSLFVYVIHKLLGDIIIDFSPVVSLFASIYAHKFLFPMVVVLSSLVVGLVALLLLAAFKRLTGGKASK